jgi:hypothetical protein
MRQNLDTLRSEWIIRQKRYPKPRKPKPRTVVIPYDFEVPSKEFVEEFDFYIKEAYSRWLESFHEEL